MSAETCCRWGRCNGTGRPGGTCNRCGARIPDAKPKCTLCRHLLERHVNGRCSASYSAMRAGVHRCPCTGLRVEYSTSTDPRGMKRVRLEFGDGHCTPVLRIPAHECAALGERIGFPVERWHLSPSLNPGA